MNDDKIIKIQNVAKRQIEHLMRTHDGKELEEKIWQLTIEWYCKGVGVGIETERKHMERCLNDGRATISNQES